MICPVCEGSKVIEITGFIHGPNYSGPVEDYPVSCLNCHGKGSLSEWTLRMQRIGWYLQDQRQEMRMLITEQADFLRMPFWYFIDLMSGKPELEKEEQNEKTTLA